MADQTPLFVSEGPSWRPSKGASGPFAGLQGGGLAGLMLTQTERSGQAEGLGRPTNVTTHFLRPAPIAALRVDVELVRRGRRVSIMDVTCRSAGDHVVAMQRTTFMSGCQDAMPRTSELDPNDFQFSGVDPTGFDPFPHWNIDKEEWMWMSMETRKDAKGRAWFRLQRPLVEQASVFAAALPAADWAHGIVPLKLDSRGSALGMPNTELCVVFSRPPQGQWIGLDVSRVIGKDGIGGGWATLSDTIGPFGASLMSFAVITQTHP